MALQSTRMKLSKIGALSVALLALAFALVFVFGMTGCASTPESEAASSAEEQAAEDEQPIPEPVGENAVATPSTAGALQVIGAQLCGEDGSPVQLRGVSTHGLAWFPQYVNQQFFTELRMDWNANVVRLAMYTGESGGYCTDGDKDELYELVRNGVAYATEADLYAIVDWHILSDSNPMQNADAAAGFFARMSADLAGNDNVIYEICNEPNGGTSWADIKRYAERIIPIIRANDPDAVIIVGTPTWSQEVDKPATDPLDADNVMYALHFYAATHQKDLRDKLATAVEGGLPVFVSEFGICDASGNGQIDYTSADAWVSLMDSLDVSYICWNLSNKDEASALFKASCSKTSGFTADDLSAEGLWLWDVLHGERTAGEAGATNDAGTASATADTAAANVASSASAMASGVTGTMGWTATLANSWEADGKGFYQYTVTVTNNGATGVNGWEVSLPLNATIELSDSWNATVAVNGSSLTLTPVSYNANLAPWASATDIGFIVSGPLGLAGLGPIAS